MAILALIASLIPNAAFADATPGTTDADVDTVDAITEVVEEAPLDGVPGEGENAPVSEDPGPATESPAPDSEDPAPVSDERPPADGDGGTEGTDTTDDADALFVDPRFRGEQPADDAELTQEEMDRLAMSTTVHEAVVEEGADEVFRTANLANFRPGNIISDQVFYNSSTMTQSQIASFISNRVSCGSSGTCLPNYREDTNSRAADQYCDGYAGARNETAAQIIYKVAQSCGLNPQAILVKLQKEQGLITMTNPGSSRYRIAMGMGCPDTAACDTRYYGFQNQVYSGVRQLILYGQSSYFTWYDPGATRQIQYHPNASCGSSGVYVENKATAALYYYTPYQPNQAALNAGYGTGNSCSAYGNRNFYNYFTDWFGSTQSPPVDECRPPIGAVATNKAYVVTAASADARISPRDSCTRNMTSLQSGTIMGGVAVAASGNWIEVKTPAGHRWMAASDLREATTSESRCTVAQGVSSAKRYYTVTKPVPGLSAPRDNCDIDASAVEVGWTVHAAAVSASRSWLRVRTPQGQKWIPRDAVEYASEAEQKCLQANGGVRDASYAFVAKTPVLARNAPRNECRIGLTELATGSVVQAVEASGSGAWIRVETGFGLRWVPRASFARASSSDMACIQPDEIRHASLTFRATRTVDSRIVPTNRCAAGAGTIASGTVVEAVESTEPSGWIRVKTGQGLRWAPRNAFERASTAERSCLTPNGGVGPAVKSYRVTQPTVARLGPRTGCHVDGLSLATGEIFTATAISGSREWLEFQTPRGPRWVSRSDVVKIN